MVTVSVSVLVPVGATCQIKTSNMVTVPVGATCQIKTSIMVTVSVQPDQALDHGHGVAWVCA